ncbi:flagellar hook-associated protein FlgL [Hydrogenovibrio kuenenii]|uniref:flagellar hook-associated protein FlgL n=1 Tax=Hydrogenovibrio kuenenii TaxID=63658 RepID=UPI000465BECB|nr:flagellar hook-associated protein FlgL [Hydrogenovibrio kuenenii]
MRVSTTQFYMQSYSAIQNNQNAVLDLQDKIASGKRVNKPSDDPTVTTQINLLNKTISNLDQYKKNGQFASSQLAVEETQLNSVVNVMQRARELTIQMGNGTYSPSDRQATSKEIGQLVDQMKSLLNSKNSQGELMFAGNSVDKPAAFVADNNPATANGNKYYGYIGSATAGASQDPQANYGSRFLQISFDSDNKLNANDKGDYSRVRITDNGTIFDLPSGSVQTTFPPGVDPNMLNLLVKLKDTLDSGQAPAASIATDLDAGIKKMSRALAEIGGRQNRIDAQRTAGDSFSIALKQRLSNLQDMDMVKGITDLTTKQNSLQIAQQVFAKVQGMSLFDYIK